MFLDTVDLIDQASSNPLVIFCLCNLIVAILFISGFKSDSPSDGPHSCNVRQVATGLPPHKRIEEDDKEEEDGNDQKNYSEDDSKNSTNNDDGDDDGDELRTRVEEFIEKINRRWQAEKMQACLRPWPSAV